jgi:hypothetical protein
MTGNLSFGDNNKVILGSGSDLQLYHDANNSFIKDSGTGSLYVQADAGVYITNASGSENKAIFTSDGAVNLYHDNALRFVTTSSGIDVTGVITTDGMTTSADINFGDNDKAVFGAGSDLQIYHDGSHSYIQDSGTGDLIIRAENFRLTDSGNTEFMLQAVPNGAVTAYFNGAAKLATTSTGIDVTGTIKASGNGKLQISDDTEGSTFEFNVGGSGALEIYDGTTERMRIDSSGEFTLGNPSSGSALQLDVSATGTDGVDIKSSYYSGGYGPMKLHVGGSERMRITSAGDVEVKGGNELRVYRTDNATYGSMEYLTGAGGLKFKDVNGDGMTFAGPSSDYMRILTGGTVGIGTSTPSSYDSRANNLVVGDSGDAGITIFSGASNDARLQFAPSGDTGLNNGLIGYDNANDKMSFATAGTDRMHINSSGIAVTGNVVSTGVSGSSIIQAVGADSNGYADVEIQSTGSTGASRLYFSDTAAKSGIVLYDHNADNMQFHTGGTLRGFYNSTGLTVTANSGSTSHYFTYNENGGEIQLYDNAGNIATLIDQSSNATRILELQNGSTFQIGHGSSNTTGIVEFRSAGFGLAGVIDANANWGLGGINNPAAPLHVSKSINNYVARFENSDASNPYTVWIREPASASSGYPLINITNNGGTATYLRVDSNNGNLYLHTTGDVVSTTSGTGLSYASGYLAVSRDTSSEAAAVQYLNRTGGDGQHLQFRKDGSPVGSIGVDNTDNLFISGNSSHAGLNFSTDAVLPYKNGDYANGSIDLGETTAAKWKDLHLSGKINPSAETSFINAYSATVANGAFVYVGSGGSITVGVPSAASRTPMSFRNTNGEVGTISTQGSSTAYNTSSDYRLKENVVAMSGATERLKQLAPKRFNFIADADVTVDGFLAHEVADVVPEAITGAKDAVDDDGNAMYQGIDQSKLVPLLVATIQELEARIAALESN